MTEPLLNVEASVLDLEIPGAFGTFAVKASGGGASIPVWYIQTNLKFTLEGGHQQRLFEKLVPVREIFNPKDLGFADLMQRDIDDSRVSTSLIPYLLSINSGEAVRFFPPIVTVVLPVGPGNQLLPRYPAVVSEVDDKQTYKRHTLRSGPKGGEALAFERVETNGIIRDFDNARLRINTGKCKIVIIDGQHRAMALLALFRNMNGWPDKTGAFEGYYKRWSKKAMQEVQLSEISLPMVVLAFPELSEGRQHPTTVVQACRTLFLALNKNARPVSTARNILLDDYDLIAHFERSILERIKNLEINSPTALRLWNFELDSDENRVAISSTVALSGVMHLYTLVERVMLSSHTPSGLHYPTQKYGKIKYLEDCLRRLDGHNLLGEEVAKQINRYAFPPDALTELIDSFGTRYGSHILAGLQSFWPYEAMAKAALDLEVELRNKKEAQCHAMLFEGQGILRVFESYIDLLSAELSEKYPQANPPPELKSLLDDFKGTAAQLEKYRTEFLAQRTAEFFGNAVAKSKQPEVLVKTISELYKNDFTTTAFQVALFMTFFSAIEGMSPVGRLEGSDSEKHLFAEYIDAVNALVKPTSEGGVKKLLQVFVGKPTGTFGSPEMKIPASSYCLRRIVIPGELKPDEWVKYRYILLEIWLRGLLTIKPVDPGLALYLHGLVSACRDDVIRAFAGRELRAYCEDKGIDLTEMKLGTKKRICDKSVDKYVEALSVITGPLEEAELERLRSTVVKAHAVEDEEEVEDEDPES